MTPLLPLVAVDCLSILSPGPNILLVMQTAVEHSRRRALVTALGLVAGSLAWATVALSGLSALFALTPGLQAAIRICGAAYLIYLGVRLWRSSGAARAEPEDISQGLARGLFTGLMNPKSVAYFASIFVLFVPADAPFGLRAAILAVVALDGLACYGAVALLFSAAGVRRRYEALRRPIDRVCGALMLGFGARLIAARF